MRKADYECARCHQAFLETDLEKAPTLL